MKSASVSLLYSALLPASLGRWDPHFHAQPDSAHEVNVRSHRPDGVARPGYLWLRDPLGRGSYRGQWVHEDRIVTAAAALSNGSVTALIVSVHLAPILSRARWPFLSETDERVWRDCAYASWLMALHDFGLKKAVLTPAERNALERSDDRPNETGATHHDLIVAALRRYLFHYSGPFMVGRPASFLAAMHG